MTKITTLPLSIGLMLSLTIGIISCKSEKNENNHSEQTNGNPADSNKTKETNSLPVADSIPLFGSWSNNCDSDNSVFFDEVNTQFTVIDRFSMNSQLKKIGNNKYEFYFTDFPPIIPLPEQMEHWDNMDKEKPVGYIEVEEKRIRLTWFGFYYKKTKQYIQTKNPFSNDENPAILIKCSDR